MVGEGGYWLLTCYLEWLLETKKPFVGTVRRGRF